MRFQEHCRWTKRESTRLLPTMLRCVAVINVPPLAPASPSSSVFHFAGGPFLLRLEGPRDHNAVHGHGRNRSVPHGQHPQAAATRTDTAASVTVSAGQGMEASWTASCATSHFSLPSQMFTSSFPLASFSASTPVLTASLVDSFSNAAALATATTTTSTGTILGITAIDRPLAVSIAPAPAIRV